VSAQGVGRAAAKTVHFGNEAVSPAEKTARVAGVFDAVASRYDVMNDLMSLGAHRILKRISVESTGLRPGGCVLDLAGGTGDMARLLAPVVGASGRVVLCDINAAMLGIGRDRLLNAGLVNVATVRGDAECLPFPADMFDCVVIAFGLRNLEDREAGLREMGRVTRAGGRLVVLEFGRPGGLFGLLYAAYFRVLVPLVGRLVSTHPRAYSYLPRTVSEFPGAERLSEMIREAGFGQVRHRPMTGGVVILHEAAREAS